MRDLNERGIAMITTLLVLMLMSALLVGFTAVIMSDQRYRFIDHDRGQAYYAASGGIEKLTSDLGNLFFAQLAPTNAQVTALTAAANLPTIPGITYSASAAPGQLPASFLAPYYCGPSPPAPKTTSPLTVGTIGYTITFCTDPALCPGPLCGSPVVTSNVPVVVGPYAGLIALQTPYQLDVTAKTSTGGEVHLVRSMDSVAIPVFQFGTFSDVDLSFFAGSNFNFGGRVHTNGNIFLAEGTGSTLTMNGKVTAVGEVITQQLQNGVSIDTGPAHVGTVNVATSSSAVRPLDRTEGSLTAGMGPPLSSRNEPTWHTVSLSSYNGFLRNGRTGATLLKLPLLTVGGTNPDLIRRPCQAGASTLTVIQASPLPPLVQQPCGAVSEAVSNPVLLNERLFTKASLRILLSDTAADITNLPGLTAPLPVPLDGNWNTTVPNNGTAYGPISAANPPIARTPGATGMTVAAAQAATGWSTLRVNGIPAVPQLTITKAPAAPRTVNCTGKTATTFTGCTSFVPVLASGATVTTAAGAVNSSSPTTTTNAIWLTLTTTVSVVNTGLFSPTWFYVPDASVPGANALVSCTGYDTTPQFTGCATTYAGGTPKVANGAVLTANSLSAAQTGTIGGYIKIEKQDTTGVWTDVTMEILNYGIRGPNMDGTTCVDPSTAAIPTAILQIQRYRDNGGDAGGCSYLGSTNAADYWPNALFDPREALHRDIAPAGTNVILGGVMYYIAIETKNLAKWFQGTAPFNTPGGANANKNNGGFTVYFSDRRNNRNAANLETAEYGAEDFVNPASATGAPNAALDVGEDVNGNGVLDTYGAVANWNGTSGARVPGAVAPLDATNAIPPTPLTSLKPGEAQVNRSILFRHALMLVDGNNIVGQGVTGLTIVAENPVYVLGDWNSFDVGTGVSDFLVTQTHAATSIIADAVTLLSNDWSDTNSFTSPFSWVGRPVTTTQPFYRVAIIGGKGMAFPQPAGTATDFGTDGGAHNFLRFLEDGGQQVNYQGATATFFYNRQALGTYKYTGAGGTVYNPPTRNFIFDTDFLDPTKLPPNTPVFRDINAVGFSQELRPGK
jgi:hypothetical protein